MDSLLSHPNRDAVASLRGYSYQIWVSLLSWIEMHETEVIYLEGAKDVDILGPNDSAETVQVKETAVSGAITLRTESVLKAINNHWENQKRNPQWTDRMRYMTTSERGREQRNPFGGARGLDVWDLGKGDGELSPLRKHLTAQKKHFSKDLIEFIQSAKDDEIRSRLLDSIDWDTGNPIQSGVEETVLAKLIAHGKTSGYQYSEYQTVVDQLLRHVWDTVLRKTDTKLTKVGFLREFELAMTERIDKAELRKLRSGANPWTPSQVPTAMPDFTGRGAELKRVDNLFKGSQGRAAELVSATGTCSVRA